MTFHYSLERDPYTEDVKELNLRVRFNFHWFIWAEDCCCCCRFNFALFYFVFSPFFEAVIHSSLWLATVVTKLATLVSHAHRQAPMPHFTCFLVSNLPSNYGSAQSGKIITRNGFCVSDLYKNPKMVFESEEYNPHSERNLQLKSKWEGILNFGLSDLSIFGIRNNSAFTSKVFCLSVFFSFSQSGFGFNILVLIAPY